MDVINSHCFSLSPVKRAFEAYIRNLISFAEANKPDDEEGKMETEEGEGEKKEDSDDDEMSEEDVVALLNKLFGSNIKKEEEKQEFFDSEEEFSQKMDKVTEWMKECKHIIVFTGAGVSTRLVRDLVEHMIKPVCCVVS